MPDKTYQVLFLSYWNIDDPLTTSTVFPHLKILKNIPSISSITLISTQREEPSNAAIATINNLGVKYIPIYSRSFKINILTKIADFILFPLKIRRLLAGGLYNFIIARGAPAGALAYLSTRTMDIPFIVESFEPHSQYMRYSRTWKTYDPRYVFQHLWEKKQKKYSEALITVSENYKEQLQKEGVSSSKIYVAPCSVDTSVFYPDSERKKVMRQELNIPNDATVGIYAGKFGNLYYDDEAFLLFKEAFEFFPNFFLILLTNHDKIFLKNRFTKFKIPEEKCIVKYVPHDEMPFYLNASDFAFAPIKNLPVSRYQSPVKIGEYLACGLPVLLTEGVGDESEFLEKENGGVIIGSYKRKNIEETFYKLKRLLNEASTNKIVQLAIRKRSQVQIKEAYNKIFLNLK